MFFLFFILFVLILHYVYANFLGGQGTRLDLKNLSYSMYFIRKKYSQTIISSYFFLCDCLIETNVMRKDLIWACFFFIFRISSPQWEDKHGEAAKFTVYWLTNWVVITYACEWSHSFVQRGQKVKSDSHDLFQYKHWKLSECSIRAWYIHSGKYDTSVWIDLKNFFKHYQVNKNLSLLQSEEKQYWHLGLMNV